MSLDLNATQTGSAQPSTPIVQDATGANQTQTPVTQTNTDTTGDLDVSAMDPKTQAYVQRLRKEAAKYRTEAKTATELLTNVGRALGVQEDETPEQRVQRLHFENEQVAFENAVLSNALEHGVNQEGMEYFRFLVAKAAGSLEEGEELSVETIAEYAKEARAKSIRQSANTTVTNQTLMGGSPPPATNAETITVETFATMGFNAKCKLFESNPSLYESLMTQATQKRLLK